MSVELLKLTSASLPSSQKPVPRICKPVASTLPAEIFDDSTYSPLPTNKATKETSMHCQVDSIIQGPVFQQPMSNPSCSPITVRASDNFPLFGTPTSSINSNHEQNQNSMQSILSSNTSTPNSIRVKISSSKLKEIPSPHNGDDSNSLYDADMQTPPRALGIPASKKNYQSKVLHTVL